MLRKRQRLALSRLQHRKNSKPKRVKSLQNPETKSFVINARQTVLRAVDDTWSSDPNDPFMNISRSYVRLMPDSDIRICNNETIINRIVSSLPTCDWRIKKDKEELKDRKKSKPVIKKCHRLKQLNESPSADESIDFIFRRNRGSEDSETDSEDASSQQKFRACYENCLRKKGVPIKKFDVNFEDAEEAHFCRNPEFLTNVHLEDHPDSHMHWVYYHLGNDCPDYTPEEDEEREWEEFTASNDLSKRNLSHLTIQHSQNCRHSSRYSDLFEPISDDDCSSINESVPEVHSSDEYSSDDNLFSDTSPDWGICEEKIEERARHLDSQFLSCTICQDLITHLIITLRNHCDACQYLKISHSLTINCPKCLNQLTEFQNIQKQHCFQWHSPSIVNSCIPSRRKPTCYGAGVTKIEKSPT